MAKQEKLTRLTKHGVIEGGLTIEGDLTCTENLWVDGDLVVSGSVRVFGNIVVAGNAEVGGDVRGQSISVRGVLSAARGSILATSGLRAGGDISAGGAIEAHSAIYAGGALRAGWWVKSDRFDIVCTELMSGRLPFGREYWASQPSLKRWRDAILDPSQCWGDWIAMLSETDRAWLVGQSFGHWSLDGQMANYLGEATSCLPPESSRPHPSRPAPAPAPAQPSAPRDEVNMLAFIAQQTDDLPFPDYSGNATFDQIVSTIGMDPRSAYADMDVDLNTFYTKIDLLTVSDQAVKQEILNEVSAALNIRSLITNQAQFLNTVFIANADLLTYVGGMVKAEAEDACKVGVLSLLGEVVSAIGDTGGEAAIVATVMEAAIELSGVAGFGTGINDIDAAVGDLAGALATQFGVLTAANVAMGANFLTNYLKLIRVNALIMDKIIYWPIDDSPAVTAATNSYELSIFKVLLPLHWWPTFSYYVFNEDTRQGCGNTVWMQYGGWGAINQQSNWVAYWITFGAYWWSDLSAAENELARIGVSIEDLTMGTGAWGSSIWSWNRGNNALGEDDRPSCVHKS